MQSIALGQAAVAEKLRRSGLSIETAVAAGKPGRAILKDAREFGADLIVAGAREQGPLEAALLGSVSGEIVERARCSVLIGRGPSVRRVLLATDGSVTAGVAARVVTEWPLFATSRIRVLCVGDAGAVATEPTPGGDPASAGDAGASATSRIEPIVNETVALLTAGGRDVEAEARVGDPGSEIVAAARDWQADLVVLGSNGEPLLRRLFLGSVARKVLHGIDSSALVVRAPARANERATASARHPTEREGEDRSA